MCVSAMYTNMVHCAKAGKMHRCVHVRMYAHAYVCADVCMCGCVYVRMYVRADVCMNTGKGAVGARNNYF